MSKRQNRERKQLELVAWFQRLAAYPLTAEQRLDLEEWERKGGTPTSDWPHWESLIGPPPF
jgi:hypothetical protein